VHPNEYHLKPAHKVARHEQLEAPVTKRFAQGGHDGLLAPGRGALPAKTGLSQAPRQRGDDQYRRCQRDQCVLPAQGGDQKPLDRHHQELAEGASGGRHAHGPRTPLGWDLPPDDAVDDRVGGARLRGADEHPCRQGKRQAGGGQRHAHEAERVEDGPRHQHPKSAKPVGQHARKHPEDTP